MVRGVKVLFGGISENSTFSSWKHCKRHVFSRALFSNLPSPARLVACDSESVLARSSATDAPPGAPAHVALHDCLRLYTMEEKVGHSLLIV